jgi:hypothetical protein
MATMTSGSAPVNNGGTAKGVNSSSVLDNLSVASTRTEKELPSTEIYAASADSLEFTNFHTGNTPVAKQITSDLFGSDPSLLNGVHSRVGTATVSQFTKALRSNRFNEYTGEWQLGYPQSTSETYGTADSAATGAGNISYRSAKPTIVTKAYDA